MDNFFELYDLPQTFTPDAAAVKSKFYELSRRYHPDRFTQSGTDGMAQALHMASLNNAAYKTLTNPDRLMAYLLKLHQLLEDEEKYALPPAFLMEMMDLNEAVSDYEDNPTDAARQQVTAELDTHLATWETAAAKLTGKYDPTAPDNTLLLQIKDMYYRKKYLLRIKERITTFAAHQ